MDKSQKKRKLHAFCIFTLNRTNIDEQFKRLWTICDQFVISKWHNDLCCYVLGNLIFVPNDSQAFISYIITFGPYIMWYDDSFCQLFILLLCLVFGEKLRRNTNRYMHTKCKTHVIDSKTLISYISFIWCFWIHSSSANLLQIPYNSHHPSTHRSKRLKEGILK